MHKITFDFDTVARKPKISSELFNVIREHFSAEDKAQAFIRRRTGRNIPVRKYAITPSGNYDFPFFPVLHKYISTIIHPFEFNYTQEMWNVIGERLVPLSEEIDLLALTPRDYQLEAVQIALKKGRGIIVLPTSAGKTLVMGMMANTVLKRTNHRILILVPDIQLVQQSTGDLLEYGIESSLISKWTGSNEYQNTKIVVANSQILLSEKTDTSILKSFNVIIVDECHKFASAEKISKLIKKLNCKHIFGLTGSLPEAQYDVWTLNRIFGDILYELKSIDLRNEKYISKVRVVSLEIEYKNPPVFSVPSMAAPTIGYEEETIWLQTNEYRNSLIYKLIDKMDTNTLILVDRIAHGEHLLEFLKEHSSKQIFFVQGSVEVEEREHIKQLMEKSDGVVCIAISKIFSTGISIKNLHNIIFAAIGKARIKIIQSIGRSLRLHHSKEMATIFDIADTSLTYGFKHFEERKRLYVSENIPLISSKIVEK
jgi:superfamily II DNA or RNA helicase